MNIVTNFSSNILPSVSFLTHIPHKLNVIFLFFFFYSKLIFCRPVDEDKRECGWEAADWCCASDTRL